MPPAQKPTGAEDAESALTREQPVTAAAATPTPVNNESAGAEGAEFIAQDLSQDPPGNDDLLAEGLEPPPSAVTQPFYSGLQLRVTLMVWQQNVTARYNRSDTKNPTEAEKPCI